MPCYMNSGFSCTKDNTMHNFYNLPSNIICSNVFWDVFSSSSYENEIFITLKSMKGLPCLTPINKQLPYHIQWPTNINL
jgi:hypothetical protein